MDLREKDRGRSGIEPIPREDRLLLLQTARSALSDYLLFGKVPDLERAVSPHLSQHRAVFVSLHHRDSGALRGCLGEYTPSGPLIDSVTRMAICAATRDPRFPAVTARELPDIQIEISALTPLKPIQPDAVRVGVHGLMIVRQEAKGLLLPQVPTLYGWSRIEFLENLCLKAGLHRNAWSTSEIQLLAFESEVWRE